MASTDAGVKGAARQAPENQGLPDRGVPKIRAVALPVPPGAGAVVVGVGAGVVGTGLGVVGTGLGAGLVVVVGTGDGVNVAVLPTVTVFEAVAPVSALRTVRV